MSENVNLSITKDEAIFLNSCINALKVIWFNGTPKNEDVKNEANENGLLLENIQSKMPAFITS